MSADDAAHQQLQDDVYRMQNEAQNNRSDEHVAWDIKHDNDDEQAANRHQPVDPSSWTPIDVRGEGGKGGGGKGGGGKGGRGAGGKGKGGQVNTPSNNSQDQEVHNHNENNSQDQVHNHNENNSQENESEGSWFKQGERPANQKPPKPDNGDRWVWVRGYEVKRKYGGYWRRKRICGVNDTPKRAVCRDYLRWDENKTLPEYRKCQFDPNSDNYNPIWLDMRPVDNDNPEGANRDLNEEECPTDLY